MHTLIQIRPCKGLFIGFGTASRINIRSHTGDTKYIEKMSVYNKYCKYIRTIRLQ
jgi:hypothetical protein